MEQILEEKAAKLKLQIDEYTKNDIIVAFSGGVDSSLLLKLACKAAQKHGTRVYAITVKTRLHPLHELENAKNVAKEIGALHVVLSIDELQEAGILDNPTDRCYKCKKYLFEKMKERAKTLGIEHILEGTNEDDLHVYRPGIRALEELCIISPLADAGFTKAEVRELAQKYGLSVSNRPAMPCLATRFPYGASLSYEAFGRVEQGETYLKNFGAYNVRLRIHDDTARIEVDEADFPTILKNKSAIIKYLKSLGYTYITLDLEGFRSGSMDVHL